MCTETTWLLFIYVSATLWRPSSSWCWTTKAASRGNVLPVQRPISCSSDGLLWVYKPIAWHPAHLPAIKHFVTVSQTSMSSWGHLWKQPTSSFFLRGWSSLFTLLEYVSALHGCLKMFTHKMCHLEWLSCCLWGQRQHQKHPLQHNSSSWKCIVHSAVKMLWHPDGKTTNAQSSCS